MSDQVPTENSTATADTVINYDQTPTSPEAPATAPQSSETQAPQSQSPESNEAAQKVPAAAEQQPESKQGEPAKSEEQKPVGVMDAYADEKTEAPIQYEFKDSEGLVVKNETTALISDLAKDLGLTQEAAQKLFERGSGDDGIISKINQNAIKHYNQEWGKQIESDPELGGSRLDDTRLNVAKAMTLDTNGELREFLKNSGMGNFPPLVKFLNKVGAQLHSDRNFITGKPAASQAKKDALATMYTSM